MEGVSEAVMKAALIPICPFFILRNIYDPFTFSWWFLSSDKTNKAAEI